MSRLLDSHADLDQLRELFDSFERRIAERDGLLQQLYLYNNNASPPGQSVFCWPISSSSSLSTGRRRLVASSDEDTVFLSDSAETVDEDDLIVYPEFVDILHRRRASFRLTDEEARIQITLHTENGFLSGLFNTRSLPPLCSMSREELVAVHGAGELLLPFARERLATMVHYRAERLSPLTHKARCVLSDVVMHAVGIIGGELVLYPCGDADADDYILILSSGYLTPARKKKKRTTQQAPFFELFVPCSRSAVRCRGIRSERAIDVTRLLTRDEACLIRSREKLTIKFTAHTHCYLATRGLCGLHVVGAASLDLWSGETHDTAHFPVDYIVDSSHLSRLTAFRCVVLDARLCLELERRSVSERLLRYRALFDDPVTGERADISLDSEWGALLFLSELGRQRYTNARGVDFNIALPLPPLFNQYSTFVYGVAEEEARAQISAIVALYNGREMEFWLPSSHKEEWNKKERLLKRLIVHRQSYGDRYYVCSLHKQHDTQMNQPFVFFYANLRERVLLFIPPDDY